MIISIFKWINICVRACVCVVCGLCHLYACNYVRGRLRSDHSVICLLHLSMSVCESIKLSAYPSVHVFIHRPPGRSFFYLSSQPVTLIYLHFYLHSTVMVILVWSHFKIHRSSKIKIVPKMLEKGQEKKSINKNSPVGIGLRPIWNWHTSSW